MKKHLSKIITLALLLSFSTIYVNANYFKASPITFFEVDFDFQIGNKLYPKGKYRLSREKQSILILENLTTPKTKVLLGVTNQKTSSINYESKLSFNRYGDTYFLRKIVSPKITAKIKLSKNEKKIRKANKKKLARVNIENDKGR